MPTIEADHRIYSNSELLDISEIRRMSVLEARRFIYQNSIAKYLDLKWSSNVTDQQAYLVVDQQIAINFLDQRIESSPSKVRRLFSKLLPENKEIYIGAKEQLVTSNDKFIHIQGFKNEYFASLCDSVDSLFATWNLNHKHKLHPDSVLDFKTIASWKRQFPDNLKAAKTTTG